MHTCVLLLLHACTAVVHSPCPLQHAHTHGSLEDPGIREHLEHREDGVDGDYGDDSSYAQ